MWCSNSEKMVKNIMHESIIKNFIFLSSQCIRYLNYDFCKDVMQYFEQIMTAVIYPLHVRIFIKSVMKNVYSTLYY